MNRIPRLLCLTALAGSTALAQTTAAATLPSDPMLASERLPDAQTSGVSHPPEVVDDAYSDTAPAPLAETKAAETKAAKPSAAHLRNETRGDETRGSESSGAQSSGAQSTAARTNVVSREQSSGASRDDQLQAAALEPAQPQLEPRANVTETVLPVATVLRIKLVLPISTATARPGEKFFATLTSPVVVDGRTIIPSGTSVTCRVDGAHGGRRFAGKPSLTIRAVSVQLPSGEVLRFTASVIDSATPHRLDVDQEGRVRGKTFNPMDKIETGTLAGAGLIAGAVIAGGPAAIFIGAASGAALGAGHVLVKHKDLTLPAGTELIFELDAPATVHNPVDASL